MTISRICRVKLIIRILTAKLTDKVHREVLKRQIFSRNYCTINAPINGCTIMLSTSEYIFRLRITRERWIILDQNNKAIIAKETKYSQEASAKKSIIV